METWDSLKNKHIGETGIIIANGPGLNNIPLSFLQKYPSIGTNKIFLLNGFIPNYYAVTNQLVIKQNYYAIFNFPSLKFSLKFLEFLVFTFSKFLSLPFLPIQTWYFRRLYRNLCLFSNHVLAWI